MTIGNSHQALAVCNEAGRSGYGTGVGVTIASAGKNSSFHHSRATGDTDGSGVGDDSIPDTITSVSPGFTSPSTRRATSSTYSSYSR